MKKIIRALFLLLATSALLLPGCARMKRTLHVYNWTDYILPELVAEFEQKFDCKVVMDYYDSNESLYAKVKAGASGYDVLFPSSYMVSIMHSEGMLRDLDHELLPNIANIDTSYLKFTMDPGMKHSVPYMISNSGIGYLASKVTGFEPTWSMFDRQEFPKRFTLMNDMREVLGAALKLLGYSLNTTDNTELEQAKAVVLRWKKNIAKFESEQYKNGLASGEFVMVHGYNGDVAQAMEENDDIVYVIPREGTSIASDDMVVPKDAREPKLAHEFINFLHDPQVAARNTEFIYYLCPNTPSYALLSEEIKADPAVFMPPDVLAKSEAIVDLGVNNAKYSRIWDEIKAAQ